jgi:AcrR family transcriptional regulator
MEKMDIRVQYTRKVLQDSLIELMKEKSILNIPIREICDRSGVSRSTFYTYYKDQYDLLRKMEERASLEAEAIFQQYTRKGRRAGGSITTIMQDILQYVVNNSNSIQVLLGENGDNTYQKKYFKYAIKQIQQAVETTGIKQPGHSAETGFPSGSLGRGSPPRGTSLDVPDRKMTKYGSVFIVGGAIALVQEWLKNGMDMPVPQLAKMLSRLIQEALS